MAKGYKLTQKQENFCLNLFKGLSQRQAYVEAGYSSRMALSTLDENSCRLAATSKIKTRLAELRKKAEDASVMNVLERKQRLTEISRARLTDFMELGQDGSWVNIGKETPQSAAIQEIHSRTEYDDNGSHPTVHTSVKLHDPMKAIDILNRMDKIYAESEGKGVNINLNQKLEAQVVHFDAKEVARAIIEAERLGLTPGVLGGNGHREDASVLPSPADIQATSVPEP